MTITHNRFREQGYFSSLDGVRAASALLVLVYHLPEEEVWGWLRGDNGVQAFFVLSGFLITTLCLREMRTTGTLSLSRFYVRRTFRILPLYALTVAAYALVAWAGDDWSAFHDRLVYYATFNGEFAGDGHFRHSWTLGIEEKYYLVWPILIGVTVALGTRCRLLLVGAVFGFTAATAQIDSYVSLFLGLVSGSFLAVLLDDRRAFGMLRVAAARASLTLTVLALTAVTHFLSGSDTFPWTGSVLPVLLTGCLGALLLRPPGRVDSVLSSTLLRWVGRRSYGVYLVHGLAIQAVGATMPPDVDSVPTVLVRLTLIVLLSLAMADFLHRSVERPCISAGRAVMARPGRSVRKALLRRSEPGADEHRDLSATAVPSWESASTCNAIGHRTGSPSPR